MRDIEFRGKRKDNGEWVSGFLFVSRPNNYYILTDLNWWDSRDCVVNIDAEEVDPDTVGQYTGLLDHNNVKIFEGDIFRTYLETLAVVEWVKDGRFLGFTIEFERKIIYIDREPKVEVIGNIYDNSELLKGDHT